MRKLYLVMQDGIEMGEVWAYDSNAAIEHYAGYSRGLGWSAVVIKS